MSPHKPPKNLNDLFVAAKPELASLDPSAHVRRSITRERVLDLTDVVLRSWRPLIEQLEAELSHARFEQRKAELARVDTRAWVFYTADLAASESHSDVPRVERTELGDRVSAHDKFLLKWAIPLFEDDPRLAPTLRDISRGTGSRDDAEDVLRLVALYRDNWDGVVGKTEVSKLRLDQAEADATAQVDLLRGASSNPARQLANAAYTLWFRDYDELMQLGRYLTRREPDSATRFPGVRAVVGSSAEPEPVESSGSNEPTLDEALG